MDAVAPAGVHGRLALVRGQGAREAADLARQAPALAEGSYLTKKQAHTRVVPARAEARLSCSGKALDLRAEFVTWLTCETALGQREPGECFVGLTHALPTAEAGAIDAPL
ncbi:MAG TPA: hypothetical protein VFG08_07560 [Candidatus Polarisedimenticolia bacterium]|nr:hypothetical protein [Candidatus Polarisedimenticolia bacterium]